MAKFHLSACPAWRYRDQHGTSTVSHPMSRVGERQPIEARNLAEIKAAVKKHGEALTAAYPGVTFSVFVSIAPRDRKPNGFDAAYRNGSLGTEAWMQERDYNGKPLSQVAAVLPAAEQAVA